MDYRDAFIEALWHVAPGAMKMDQLLAHGRSITTGHADLEPQLSIGGNLMHDFEGCNTVCAFQTFFMAHRFF